jgi:threonine synthase
LGGSTTTHSAVHGQQVSLDGAQDGARAVCLLCGVGATASDLFWGCAACGVAAPLTLDYPPAARSDRGLLAAVQDARRAFGSFPLANDGAASRSPTPLDAAARFGPGVYLKNEAFSLTGSHKDRYHAVAVRVARRLGARGIVASSTGNHGVSAAAHAAAAGLPAVVFCHPEAPAGLLRAIGAFGGVAAQLDPPAQREALVALVRDGWFPATSMDPALSGAGNPFGAEGYKAVAYETVEQLGMMPDAVFIPTAGGDTLFGLMRGFAELAALAAVPMPVVFAIQPEGANALSRSLAAGHQVTVEHPASIALSLSDQQTGRHAMVAMSRWHGQALDVAETDIRTAIVDLAKMGVYADPASAAALAGYRLAVASGIVDSSGSAVLLLTSSGFKWPNAMAEVFPAGAVKSVDRLQQCLEEFVAMAGCTVAPATRL